MRVSTLLATAMPLCTQAYNTARFKTAASGLDRAGARSTTSSGDGCCVVDDKWHVYHSTEECDSDTAHDQHLRSGFLVPAAAIKMHLYNTTSEKNIENPCGYLMKYFHVGHSWVAEDSIFRDNFTTLKNNENTDFRWEIEDTTDNGTDYKAYTRNKQDKPEPILCCMDIINHKIYDPKVDSKVFPQDITKKKSDSFSQWKPIPKWRPKEMCRDTLKSYNDSAGTPEFFNVGNTHPLFLTVTGETFKTCGDVARNVHSADFIGTGQDVGGVIVIIIGVIILAFVGYGIYRIFVVGGLVDGMSTTTTIILVSVMGVVAIALIVCGSLLIVHSHGVHSHAGGKDVAGLTQAVMPKAS